MDYGHVTLLELPPPQPPFVANLGYLTFANMSSSIFNGGITIDVRQLTQTKSIQIGTSWIGKAIDDDDRRLTVKYFTNSRI